MRKRRPVDSGAAESQAVDYLLREFKGIGLKTPTGYTGTPSTGGGGGPIETSYLTAAVDARPELIAVADFKCGGVSDEVEMGAAVSAIYRAGVGNGGVHQLTEGNFKLTDYHYCGPAVQSYSLRGAGIGATIIESLYTAEAPFARGGLVEINAENGNMSDIEVIAEGDKFASAVAFFPFSAGAVIERVSAYVYPDTSPYAYLEAAFTIDGGNTIRDCVVEPNNEGTGILTYGDEVRIIDNWVQAATSQGYKYGDGILVDTGCDNCVVMGNLVYGPSTGYIEAYGIRVIGDNCIVIGNNCPDGIYIDAAADGTIVGGNTGTVTDNGTNTVFLDNDQLGSIVGSLTVDQDSTTGAVPVLTLDQADVDEDFIKFIGTSDTNVDRALVDAADFTTPGTVAGWLKINIQDDQGTNPITDGDYYIPFYSAPSA